MAKGFSMRGLHFLLERDGFIPFPFKDNLELLDFLKRWVSASEGMLLKCFDFGLASKEGGLSLIVYILAKEEPKSIDYILIRWDKAWLLWQFSPIFKFGGLFLDIIKEDPARVAWIVCKKVYWESKTLFLFFGQFGKSEIGYSFILRNCLIRNNIYI